MNAKKFWFAALAYLVLTFVFAAGWHLVVFAPVYESLNVFTRKEPLFMLGILSMVIQAFVVAYLYPRFYRGGSPIRAGALFGLLLGLFMGSNAVLAEAGKNEVGDLTTWILIEGAFYLVWSVAVGIVVALVYGRKEV